VDSFAGRVVVVVDATGGRVVAVEAGRVPITGHAIVAATPQRSSDQSGQLPSVQSCRSQIWPTRCT
jgi:hypothetical protein